MLLRFRHWRHGLSTPAFLAFSLAHTLAVCVLVALAALPFVGWPDAFWWGVGALPFVLVLSGFEWMQRKDPIR